MALALGVNYNAVLHLAFAVYDAAFRLLSTSAEVTVTNSVDQVVVGALRTPVVLAVNASYYLALWMDVTAFLPYSITGANPYFQLQYVPVRGAWPALFPFQTAAEFSNVAMAGLGCTSASAPVSAAASSSAAVRGGSSSSSFAPATSAAVTSAQPTVTPASSSVATSAAATSAPASTTSAASAAPTSALPTCTPAAPTSCAATSAVAVAATSAPVVTSAPAATSSGSSGSAGGGGCISTNTVGGSSSSDTSLSKGAVAGIVIGCVVGSNLLLLACLFLCCGAAVGKRGETSRSEPSTPRSRGADPASHLEMATVESSRNAELSTH